MKHLFILNPVAGGLRKKMEKKKAEISAVMDRLGEDYELYCTTAPMDACDKIRAESEKGGELRIYACGGDGTLNECINGAAGLDNVAVTHFPCGTGNDFIKSFGESRALFTDLEKLVRGYVRPIDLIDCSGRYSVNICSVGLDARVCQDVHKYSRIPLIGGAAAYVVSLVVNMAKGPNMHLNIRSGDQAWSGSYALLCACNGQYYGGGFRPVPEAVPNDGRMDVLMFRRVSRLSFFSMVGKYASGRYRELPEKMWDKLEDSTLEISSDGPFVVNLDGEVITLEKAVFSLKPGAVQMFFPEGMAWPWPEKSFSAVR